MQGSSLFFDSALPAFPGFRNMKLIVISPPSAENPCETEQVTLLFENGLNYFHLRKPDWKKEELRAYLRQIPGKFHNRISLHTHYDLSYDFNLMGIHLPEKVRVSNEIPREYLNKMQQKKLFISSSFHSTEDLKQNKHPFDYVFLSPVFKSISKPGHQNRFTIPDLKEALNSVSFPVIALGGVQKNNISYIAEYGFAGAAAMGTIWQSKEPLKQFKELLAKSQLY